MNAREGASTDGATIGFPDRHGHGTRESHRDGAGREHQLSWATHKSDGGRHTGQSPKHSLGLLDTSRVRVDQELKRARALRARIKQSGARYYQEWIIEGLLRQKPLPPSKDGRHIPLKAGAVRHEPLLDERSGKHYAPNSIRSNRYTLLSFLPKQLVFQFGRLANFYFLVIGIIQQVPGWSPTGRFTTLGPLLAFVALIMAKEGWDDYRRYLLDREDNLALVSVIERAGVSGNPPTTRTSRWLGKHEEKEGLQANGESQMPETHAEKRTDKQWNRIRWRDIRVGDIIRLERNERVPADIVLLHATGVNSVAYIDTMALDGETNLKSKQPSTLVAGKCDTIAKLEQCSGELVCEDPNADLYQFEGRITINGETMPLSFHEVVFRGSTIRNTTETIGIVINTGEECKIRLNANQYVHTKSPKISKFTNRIVVCVVFILLAIAAGISGGYALWQREYEKKNEFVRPVPLSAGTVIFGTIILINALIPLSLYIVIEFVKVFQAWHLNDIEMYDAATDTPISINTNTILEDLGQVNYIFSDKTGTLTENNMQFRRLTVGGVSWLHTMNMAESEIADKLHKHDDHDVLTDPKLTDGSDNGDSLGHLDRGPVEASASSKSGSGTEAMLDYIRRSPNSAFSKKARQFLLCIALCHTCLPETSDDGKITFQAASPDEVALVQAAQDMGHLVIDRPAQSIKLQIPNELGNGESVTETYEVLKVVEFSSSRKRMSIIVRMPDGRICVICKGADNVIMSRLRLADLAARTANEVNRRARERHSVEAGRAMQEQQQRRSMVTPRTSSYGRRSGLFRALSDRSSRDIMRQSSQAMRHQQEQQNKVSPMGNDNTHEEYYSDDDDAKDSDGGGLDGIIDESIAADEAREFERCFQHIDQYATEGLRILLYGYRYMDEAEYAAWSETFAAATTSLVDRQARVEEAAESIERELELAGASAIEDRLQAGVPETIDKLRRAGIRIWMLTGDKRETAINIARSANLAKSYSQIYILDALVSDPGDTMHEIFVDIGRGSGGADRYNSAGDLHSAAPTVSHSVLVIDGHTLSMVEADKTLRDMFFELSARTDSVICCRASPNQKATLVKGVRDAEPSCVTLAIGDGANDIAMIQASHVGIGISGREGLQAARVADYGIAQFRFLQRLLLVHGHWLYLRTSKYILCTFWKEWVFYIIQAQYQGFTGYTGTSLYQSWALTAYNAVFTSLPIFFLGLCEQDLSPETLLAVPELYGFGQRGEGINFAKCVGWLFMGTLDTVVIFVIVWAEFTFTLAGTPAAGDPSHDNSLYPMGTLALTIVIVLINVKILILEMHHKTWLPLAACALSISLWFFFTLLLDALPLSNSADGPYRLRNGLRETFGASLAWWAVAIIGIGIVIGANLGVTALQRVFFPTDRNLWQEIEQAGGLDQVLAGTSEQDRLEAGRSKNENSKAVHE